MTTQIVLASTAFGLATLTAADDSGAFAHYERRILVVVCNTAMPEATTPMHDIAGVPDLMRQFDAVYDYTHALSLSIRRSGALDREIFRCGSGNSGCSGTWAPMICTWLWRASTSTQHKHSVASLATPGSMSTPTA